MSDDTPVEFGFGAGEGPAKLEVVPDSPAARPDEQPDEAPVVPKKGVPDGVWTKCERCGEIVFTKELERNLKVCPRCDFHYPMSAWERLALLIDEHTFAEHDADLSARDPLGFCAVRPYTETLERARDKTGLTEAVITGEARIDGRDVAVGVMDFGFVGGSMGSAVGEKVTRLAERALERRIPLVTACASGGARMQEGMYSLMQMAKTSAAIGRLRRANVPYVSVLTHPTTGGVTASFPTLADIIIAEPGATVGFTGQRVIEQTIRERLPKDFQTAEFMLEHGMIDMVVHRVDLRGAVSKIIGYLCAAEDAIKAAAR